MKIFKFRLIISLLVFLSFYFINVNSIYASECGMPNMNHNPLSAHEENKQLVKEINDTRVVNVCIKDYKFYPSTITVKKDEQVKLKITNLDKNVLHGIEIKGLRINRELPFNEEITIEFKADKKGSFHFHCSVYCGPKHSKMHGVIIVN